MKYFTLVLILSVALFSCKPTAKEALEYSDKISVENNKIREKYDKLIESYNEYRPEEMDGAYAGAKKQVEESINAIKSLEEFAGDNSFRKGALELFESYLSIISNEHKRMIELLKLPEDEYQDKEKEEYERLIETSNKKIDTETDKLHKIQQEFVKPYGNITLVKDE